MGHGGITRVQKATGVSRPRITRGMRDLLTPALKHGVVRHSGGGRKRVAISDATLLDNLDALIEPTKRGDPMRGLRWTCKSTRQLAKALIAKGHTISHTEDINPHLSEESIFPRRMENLDR